MYILRVPGMADRDFDRDDPSERIDIEPTMDDIEQFGDDIDGSMLEVDTIGDGKHRAEANRAPIDRAESSRNVAEGAEPRVGFETRREGVPPGLDSRISSGLAAMPSGVPVPEWFMQVVPAIYEAALKTVADILRHRRLEESLGEMITSTVRNRLQLLRGESIR